MCGISGIYCIDRARNADLRLLRKMTELVRHRGPDDEGYLLWGDDVSAHPYSGNDSSQVIKSRYAPLDESDSAYLAFGFRRLAIIDTSSNGHQPMLDNALGLAIVFNGEIYNYLELRSELQQKGYQFQSSSDTEVILKAYHAWGESCVTRFNGIWAFALWDEKQRKLFCSRDRFGVKPFYYSLQDRTFIFGSEMKQLLTADSEQALNTAMLWRSMKINSLQVYGEETFWKDIRALEGGHNLLIQNGQIAIIGYHKLNPHTFGTSKLSFSDATEQYRELFAKSIKLQLRSDVEVGACLSGGLDSSAIVCSAASISQSKMKTFSSWFGEIPELDERLWIEEVTRFSGCPSHLVSPTATDAMAWLNDATWYNDLPVGAGFAAQYAVMQLAHKNGIKVLLDGQGSDELTAGYKHAQYRFLADLLLNMRLGTFRKEFSAFAKGQGLKELLPSMGKVLLTSLLSEKNLYAMEFRHMRFEPFNPDFTAQAASAGSGALLAKIEKTRGGKLSNFLYNEVYSTSLPTLLHWEDRMSMSVSVESRVPFLDHDLVEFAFTLPSAYKIKDASRKYIHRQAMQPLVPPAIFERRDKAIFGSPMQKLWLRREIKPYMEELLASQEFRQRGIWRIPQIHAQWQRYLRGDNSQAEMLYNIFALETWFRVFTKQ